MEPEEGDRNLTAPAVALLILFVLLCLLALNFFGRGPAGYTVGWIINGSTLLMFFLFWWLAHRRLI